MYFILSSAKSQNSAKWPMSIMAKHQSGKGFGVARGVKRIKHLCANEYGNGNGKNGETPSLIGLPEATYYDYIVGRLDDWLSP